MNNIPANSVVVVDISDLIIKLRISGEYLAKEMSALGFSVAGGFMIRSVVDEVEKINLIKELIEMDALFLFGYGWSPSEIMGRYKDNGVYNGTYKVISWSDPITYQVEER